MSGDSRFVSNDGKLFRMQYRRETAVTKDSACHPQKGSIIVHVNRSGFAVKAQMWYAALDPCSCGSEQEPPYSLVISGKTTMQRISPDAGAASAGMCARASPWPPRLGE